MYTGVVKHPSWNLYVFCGRRVAVATCGLDYVNFTNVALSHAVGHGGDRRIESSVKSTKQWNVTVFCILVTALWKWMREQVRYKGARQVSCRPHLFFWYCSEILTYSFHGSSNWFLTKHSFSSLQTAYNQFFMKMCRSGYHRGINTWVTQGSLHIGRRDNFGVQQIRFHELLGFVFVNIHNVLQPHLRVSYYIIGMDHARASKAEHGEADMWSLTHGNYKRKRIIISTLLVTLFGKEI